MEEFDSKLSEFFKQKKLEKKKRKGDYISLIFDSMFNVFS
jgi:hypothetical protein